MTDEVRALFAEARRKSEQGEFDEAAQEKLVEDVRRIAPAFEGAARQMGASEKTRRRWAKA